MAENPIRTSDLFSDDLIGGLQNIQNLVTGLHDSLKDVAADVRRVGASSSATGDAIESLSGKVSALNAAFAATNNFAQANMNAITALNQAIGATTNAVNNHTSAVQRNAQAQQAQSDAQKQQSQGYDDMKKRIDDLIRTHAKEIQQIEAEKMTYNELKGALDALKDTLNSMSGEQRKNTDAGKSMTAQALAIKDAMTQLEQSIRKGETATKSLSVAEQQRRAGMESMRNAINALNGDMTKSLQETEISKMTYNELQGAYNALKDAINALTMAEREDTEAGKSMTAQAARIMDAMNKAQQATGKFSLNVGNYRSAFDGLGFSIQQVLREIPSAVNINQFFLAISNNIPMLMDQIKAFQQQQKGIREEMANLEKQNQTATERYQQLGDSVQSLGKKIVTSIFSWQSAILGVLLLLRNWDTIVGALKKAWDSLFDSVKLKSYLKSTREAIGEFHKMSKESLVDATTELRVVVDRLENVKRGTSEWADGVGMVNKITNSNLDATTATFREVKKVTQAYVEQAKQLAKNQAVVSIIAESEKKRIQRDLSMNSTTNIQAAASLGIDVNGEEFEEFDKLWRSAKGSKSYAVSANRMRKLIVDLEKQMEEAKSATEQISINETLRQAQSSLRSFEEGARKAEIELKNYVNRKTAGILSEDALKSLYKEYDAIIEQDTGSGPSSSRGSDPTLEAMEDRYYEMMEAIYSSMEDGYTKQLELSHLANEKAMEQNEKAYDKQMEALINNLNNKLISQEVYDAKAEEALRQRNAINEALERQQQNKERELYEELVADKIKLAIKETDVVLEQTKKRTRTRLDEYEKNRTALRNINALEVRLAELEQINTQGVVTAEEEKKKAIEATTKALEEQRNMIDFSKQLGNLRNTSISDMMKKAFVEGTFDRMSNMDENESGSGRSYMEGILSSMGFNKDQLAEATEETLKSTFDSAMDVAKDQLENWYNMTTGYINDMIAAWQQLSEAKIRAAEEDVEIAQEAYEKEKSLLDAGYANNIETAKAELDEKRRLQKEAEEEAKRAQKVQEGLNTAQQVSDLITAVAGIWKSVGGMGPAGPAIAGALTATMVAAFAASKTMAIQAANAAKYGDGGYERLHGGSHAAGNDIDLGITNGGGQRMIAEGGESVGIFSRRAVSKYGNDEIERVVDAFNHGTYDRLAFSRLEREGRASRIVSTYRPSVNLHNIEKSLSNIESNGTNTQYVDKDGNLVVMRPNGQTRYIRR